MKLCIGLLLLACTACVEGLTPNQPVHLSIEPPTTVTGIITEIEFDTLSVRADDGRSLLFDITDPPVSVAYLQERFSQIGKITITYSTKESRLMPLTIVDG